MNFSTYQQLSARTAIYPREHAVVYPALGLVGECGEIANKFKKVLRDDAGAIQPEKRTQLIDEIGDVLWYAAGLARDLGIRVHDQWAVLLPKYLPTLSKCVLRITSLAGEIASAVEFQLDQTCADEPIARIEHRIANIVQFCNCILFHLGSNAAEAMQLNLDKLFSRQERGTLKGAGDNR